MRKLPTPRPAILLRTVQVAPNWAMPREVEKGGRVLAAQVSDAGCGRYFIFLEEDGKDWGTAAFSPLGTIVPGTMLKLEEEEDNES